MHDESVGLVIQPLSDVTSVLRVFTTLINLKGDQNLRNSLLDCKITDPLTNLWQSCGCTITSCTVCGCWINHTFVH